MKPQLRIGWSPPGQDGICRVCGKHESEHDGDFFGCGLPPPPSSAAEAAGPSQPQVSIASAECARCGLPGAAPTAAGMMHPECLDLEREAAYAASPASAPAT